MPVSPDSLQKQPYEQFNISVDFKKQLASDETITDVTVSATDSSDADATTTIVEGSQIVGQTIKVGIMGGVTGETYKLTCKITTDAIMPGGNFEQYEGDVSIIVVEE
ncbi:MAG TPA: hypothetical protein VMW36_10785 [Patescibacteria group bacterium]|nr:hypothetical protein [Patescibacteria group bacterium]